MKTISIAVGNGCYYGHGMKIVNDAAIDDKRLDLCSLEISHWWQILRLLPAIRQGRYARTPIRILSGQEIEVYTHIPSFINTDGEITTQTPAKFRVIPKALAVLVPRSTNVTSSALEYAGKMALVLPITLLDISHQLSNCFSLATTAF